MLATAALSPLTFVAAWALARVANTPAGQAVYSVKAEGRLIGRVEQCRRADGMGGTGFVLYLYGGERTVRTHLRTWREVRDATRNPRGFFTIGQGARWETA